MKSGCSNWLFIYYVKSYTRYMNEVSFCCDCVEGNSRCVSLPVSVNSSVTQANLTVTAESESSSGVTPYRFHSHGDISIRHNNLFTFIETDKPVYKPSDTGFRQWSTIIYKRGMGVSGGSGPPVWKLKNSKHAWNSKIGLQTQHSTNLSCISSGSQDIRTQVVNPWLRQWRGAYLGSIRGRRHPLA